MVVVFTTDHLSWLLIARTLNETLVAGISNVGSPSTSNSNEPQEHKPQSQVQNQQLQPPGLSQVVVKDEDTSINVGEFPTCPGSNEWVITIRDKLEKARQEDVAGPWGKRCIYRMPKYLRDSEDNKAFIPQTVALGPYHHGTESLQEMESHKWRAVRHILRRTNQDISMYVSAVKKLEERARSCYEGMISLSSNEFVEMMVLDGCFILEVFRGAVCGFKQLGYSRNDPVFAMRGSMHSIQRDMIMIENQIPLFILDRLYGIQSSQPDQKGVVAKLALSFFDPLMPTDEPLTKNEQTKLESSLATASFDPLADLGSLHCLDVFRRSLLRKGPNPDPKVMKGRSNVTRVADKRRQQLVHCVTELKEAGVKFTRRKTDRFWDITFKNGVLSIPRLLIHDGTRSLFLNLIAFEQCHVDCTNDITSYIIFMDNLIDFSPDVSYLHYCGIIEHWLGSDAEVAELFNRLCQEVVFDINDSYLSNLSEQINRYYNKRWNAWRATLRHRYFNNPWAIISFIAAVFLLVLTLTQTFYTAYSYYKPAS